MVNKKKMLCRLGLHDWERIGDREREALENSGIRTWLYDWVCLRLGCNKFKLTATRLRDARANHQLNLIDRKAIAISKAELHLDAI